MMVKQGKRAEANGWFNKEMEAFPSSRDYVMQLKRKLIPEYQDNNSTSAADADTTQVQEGLSPAKRKAAEKRAATVMGETDNSTEESNNTVPTTDADSTMIVTPEIEADTTSLKKEE